MPETELIEPELDPYSRLVAQSVERISPAVAGIDARSASGRGRGAKWRFGCCGAASANRSRWFRKRTERIEPLQKIANGV
jgi:hypothetical protein